MSQEEEIHIHCKCELMNLGLKGQATAATASTERKFRNVWISLDSSSFKVDADKSGEPDHFLFDVDHSSIRKGFEMKRNSVDSAREFQFISGSATYLVRVATPALSEQWCDALKSVLYVFS